MPSKSLIVIVGPTAVGKTSLSIGLAQRFKTEVISADSRQVFKEISIGTAKPTLEEMQGIPHHFIGSHSIHEKYNAGKFEQEAVALITRLFRKYDVLIMTGGSGLYVDAVCKGFDELPESDEKTRKELNDIFKNKGTEALQRLLKKYDLEYFRKADLNNPHRLIRAIEVSMISGKPYTSFRKNTPVKRDFKIIKIGLDMDREALYKKIDLRVDQMMKGGFLEEVKKIIFNFQFSIPNSLNTVGYKELMGYLEGKYTLEESVGLIKKNTRNFAKRQLTWFRKDKEIKWFDPSHQKEIINYLGKSLDFQAGGNLIGGFT